MGMIHYFSFGDVNTANFNVWVSGTGAYDSPERDVEYVSIDGRNGDLVQDNGRFHNIEVTYPCFIARTFLDNFDDFRSAMHLQRGYKRLWDSYHPLEYREAVLSAPIQPKTGVLNRSGNFDITFNCKPQRFLIEGSEYVSVYPVNLGAIDASGADEADEFTYRIEYFPVTPNSSLKATAEYVDITHHSYPLTVAFYTSSKTFISSVSAQSELTQSINATVPITAAYARVVYGSFLSPTKYLRLENNGVTTTYADGGSIFINPTGYTAQPIIKAYNATSFSVKRLGANFTEAADITTVTVSDYSSTGRTDCVVDSVIGDAYSEEINGMSAAIVNLNPYITITEDGQISDYPTFGAGGNIITGAGFTSCAVKCGWWLV